MGSNGSFYQNGLPVSTLETGVGNVTPIPPVSNTANSSFYLEGAGYTALQNADALLAAITAQQVIATNEAALALTDQTNAALSAIAAAASAATALSSLSSYCLRANNLSDLTSVPTALVNLGLNNVNNTSDVNKPVSTAQATADALVASNAAAATALKANIASPTLTGVPAAPTAAALNNSTQLATTAYADRATATLSGTVTTALALKAPLASPSFTGSETVTASSANAQSVGRLGATTPVWNVDASTAAQVAGLSLKGAVTGGTVALTVTDSGANANLDIEAKGTGTINIGTTSTGQINIGGTGTISAIYQVNTFGFNSFGLGSYFAGMRSLSGSSTLYYRPDNSLAWQVSYAANDTFLNWMDSAGTSGVITFGTGGSIVAKGGIAYGASVTTTVNYSQLATDYSVIFNATASRTLTLLNAASFPGKVLMVKTTAAFTVVSATSNVVPLIGGAAGTAILAATAGKWAKLMSDGTNWIILASN